MARSILDKLDSNKAGFDKDANLLLAGTKIYFNHLGTERSLEVDANGQLLVNGIPVEISVLLSTGTSAATANTAAFNSALALGGRIAVRQAGTFYINAQLVIPSNTSLELGPNTIIRMAAGAASTMIANAAYTAARTNITGMTSSGMTVTVATATTPTVGQWVSIHGSQTSGYNGVYLVQSVSAGVSFTYFAEILPGATTAVLSTRYANMTWGVADQNIRISGGQWYYDLANNSAGNGKPSGCAIILGHLFDYVVEKAQFYDVGTRCIYPFNARGGMIRKIRCDLTRVCIQTNGAIHGLTIEDVDSIGTDDGVVVMCRENSPFTTVLLSEGDCINVQVRRCNLNHTVAHAVALYNFDSLHVMDNVVVDGIAGNCTFGVYIAGASGTLSSFGNLEFRNIKTSSSNNPFWMRFCSIKRLKVVNFQAEVQVTGVNGFTVDASSTIDTLEIDGFTWVPATTTDTAIAIIFVTGGTAVNHFILRRFQNNSSWVPSSAGYCCAFSTVPLMWEISDSYLNAGANAVLGYINAAGKVGSFKDCEVVTARLTNGVVGGTMNLLNIERCRVVSSTNSVSIAGPMTVNFNGYSADSGTHAIQVNGAIAVTIKGSGFNFGGSMDLTFLNSPTVKVYAWDLPVDAGLLATTQGQFFTHASAVGGRNAANQQGPAVGVDGTHFYALGTGASGVNTLIL